MTGAQYLVEVLKKYEVTDAFGIPGGVILEMIYALNDSGAITPHLSYHEQAAGFSAVGYAQASGKLGVAYATRGPGFTNLVTPIADAYCDSVPVLFITSHVGKVLCPEIRLTNNQEIDTCAMVKAVTKFSKRIDTPDEFVEIIEEACYLATEGRKGPVFIDVASSVWKAEVPAKVLSKRRLQEEKLDNSFLNTLSESIRTAKRPVVLIGDGINQTKTGDSLQSFVEKCKIPVISSRYATNVIADSPYYYGYIGGFGVRYANFILSKTDLIVSLGNRLNFPLNSESYHNIPNQAKIIRIDIDKGELGKEIPHSLSCHEDLTTVLPKLEVYEADYGTHAEWLSVCDTIKKDLWDEDVNEVVMSIDTILANITEDATIVSDVGNHEFWVSRACAHSLRKGNLLYSKSFATLGSAMVKAIGAYYATKNPVVCFIGDQGFQMNIQELQYISQHQLPILTVVLNNNVSGMIRDKEKTGYKGQYIHSTSKSGYQIPNLKEIASVYNLAYAEFDTTKQFNDAIKKDVNTAGVLNLLINEDLSLEPSLPRGHQPQDMVPTLEACRFDLLNSL